MEFKKNSGIKFLERGSQQNLSNLKTAIKLRSLVFDTNLVPVCEIAGGPKWMVVYWFERIMIGDFFDNVVPKEFYIGRYVQGSCGLEF